MEDREKEIRKLRQQYAKFNTKPYLKYGLPEDEILRLKEAFDLFNVKGKGSIDVNDLKKNLNDIGILSKNVDIDKMMENNIKSVDFHKFIELMGARPACKTEEEAKKLYTVFLGDFDLNKNLCVDDFTRIANELGLELAPDEIEEMIRSTNPKNPGFISFDEFYRIMSKANY